MDNLREKVDKFQQNVKLIDETTKNLQKETNKFVTESNIFLSSYKKRTDDVMNELSITLDKFIQSTNEQISISNNENKNLVITIKTIDTHFSKLHEATGDILRTLNRVIENSFVQISAFSESVQKQLAESAITQSEIWKKQAESLVNEFNHEINKETQMLDQFSANTKQKIEQIVNAFDTAKNDIFVQFFGLLEGFKNQFSDIIISPMKIWEDKIKQTIDDLNSASKSIVEYLTEEMKMQIQTTTNGLQVLMTSHISVFTGTTQSTTERLEKLAESFTKRQEEIALNTYKDLDQIIRNSIDNSISSIFREIKTNKMQLISLIILLSIVILVAIIFG